MQTAVTVEPLADSNGGWRPSSSLALLTPAFSFVFHFSPPLFPIAVGGVAGGSRGGRRRCAPGHVRTGAAEQVKRSFASGRRVWLARCLAGRFRAPRQEAGAQPRGLKGFQICPPARLSTTSPSLYPARPPCFERASSPPLLAPRARRNRCARCAPASLFVPIGAEDAVSPCVVRCFVFLSRWEQRA
ncbi:hypothetical protein HU200_011487 [Digitaria exilis]|uniref:Uncharacterized protein n=1 Tax=Digitaria exilis TaxID=1010633 RepID=A0A835FFR9_9POAL|nr:hypothetical protein HU200_011487 [Digitaria exilis]